MSEDAVLSQLLHWQSDALTTTRPRLDLIHTRTNLIQNYAKFINIESTRLASSHGLINYIDTKAKCRLTRKQCVRGWLGMGFTPAGKSLYRSIFLDDDILHCLLWVSSFYASSPDKQNAFQLRQYREYLRRQDTYSKALQLSGLDKLAFALLQKG